MGKNTLSLPEARSLVLYAQGLTTPAPFGSSIPSALDHLGYVQIDTISVVERAHHHTLWSRIPSYQPQHLEDAVRSKQILEYWSHAAAYLPMHAYRFTLPRKKQIEKEGHWHRRDRGEMKMVLDRIRAEGPLRSADFEKPKGAKSGPWFDWKPSKRALEQLFMEGKLMVIGRQGFQKIYDLTERSLPAGIDTRFPTDSERARHLIETTLKAQGIATAREIIYLRRNVLPLVTAELKKGVHEGRLIPLQLEGSEDPYFAWKETFESWLRSAPKPGLTQILSPFDSLVIQRKRVKNFFGMDYFIECYIPEPKRKFGYFCLPVLQGDRLVARLDAKSDRANKNLIIRSLHWEKGEKKNADIPSLRKALVQFATFNGCEKISGKKP
ncbi:MAG: YcaQ family DNA glycosylase [Bdellovibrionales bacterium]|nr:YcaQ family DNA glycosylase [Bdellovibrionales bacterium]